MSNYYTLIKKLFQSEAFSYLFFGGLATLVYTLSRLIVFKFYPSAVLSSLIATIIAILFAFYTNDTFVFKQPRYGWQIRLIKFTTARLFTLFLDLALAYFFVTKFPHIIGEFVNNHLETINLIETIVSQVLIILINYIFSKVFIFNSQH